MNIAVTARVRRPDNLPDPNEIGRRIARLWPHGTADEGALRDALEVATLRRMLVDEHGYTRWPCPSSGSSPCCFKPVRQCDPWAASGGCTRRSTSRCPIPSLVRCSLCDLIDLIGQT